MFLSELEIQALTPDLWALTAPLVWEDDTGRLEIPKGFITDLASIPHVIDWVPFLDRTGLSRRAGALHDGLYALGRERGKDWCDTMLKLALEAEGMKPWQAKAYWSAVHYFGSPSWTSDAREGVFGGLAIVSGDFSNASDYAAWIQGGRTIFKLKGTTSVPQPASG